MPGIRDGNLRSGDLHEDLGILLLRGVALVAPVPRQDDVGNDAFATLLRPDGSRRLIPSLSFLAQLKSASTKAITYKSEDELAWITAMESPFFVGRVDLKQARIELFTTLRLQQNLLHPDETGIELLLDKDELPAVPSIRRVYLGPPVHAWSIAEIGNREFLQQSHAVICPHIETLQRNRMLRCTQTQNLLSWVTGQPPTSNGESFNLTGRTDIADTLRDMAPHARRLLFEICARKRYGDFPVVLALIALMRRWGADPDPGGGMSQMTGWMAKGPEIPVEEAIRIRCIFQRPLGKLDLSDLPLCGEAISAIPVSVTQLALRDTALTDACIPWILKLTELTRLNLAGTRITDEGLALLAGLKHLEWICVDRTPVTAAGVDRMKLARPDVTVMIGGEPNRPSNA